MNCNEFQRRLEEALDDHGAVGHESAAFAEHVGQCGNASCAEAWRRGRAIAAAVGVWRNSVPAVDLVETVTDALHNSSLAMRQRSEAPSRIAPVYRLVRDASSATGRHGTGRTGAVGRSWGAVSVAASLLLVVCLLSLSRSSRVDDRSANLNTPTEDSQIAEAPLAAEADDAPGPASLRHSYAAMPLHATEFVTDAVVFVVPADLTDPDDEPSRADLWAKHLEKRLEPIGKELSSAFESLLRVVPGASSSST